MTNVISMDAKKKRTADRHAPAKMVRIRPALGEPLSEYAASIASTETEVVNAAVREKLAAAGHWPPKKK